MHQSTVDWAYDGGNGETLFAGVLKQLEDVVANNDTSLAAQNIADTHFESSVLVIKLEGLLESIGL